MTFTNSELMDAVEYYRENAFGYSSVREYVKLEFWFVKDKKDIDRIVKFIKDNL